MPTVSITDVLQKIAQGIRDYSGNDPDAAITEFFQSHNFDFNLAITTDVEESEADFMERYGHGYTFYFRLADYEHGKLLARQMYWIFLGQTPNMDKYDGSKFTADDKLFLFVHVRNIVIE